MTAYISPETLTTIAEIAISIIVGAMVAAWLDSRREKSLQRQQLAYLFAQLSELHKEVSDGLPDKILGRIDRGVHPSIVSNNMANDTKRLKDRSSFAVEVFLSAQGSHVSQDLHKALQRIPELYDWMNRIFTFQEKTLQGQAVDVAIKAEFQKIYPSINIILVELNTAMDTLRQATHRKSQRTYKIPRLRDARATYAKIYSTVLRQHYAWSLSKTA